MDLISSFCFSVVPVLTKRVCKSWKTVTDKITHQAEYPFNLHLAPGMKSIQVLEWDRRSGYRYGKKLSRCEMETLVTVNTVLSLENDAEGVCDWLERQGINPYSNSMIHYSVLGAFDSNHIPNSSLAKQILKGRYCVAPVYFLFAAARGKVDMLNFLYDIGVPLDSPFPSLKLEKKYVPQARLNFDAGDANAHLSDALYWSQDLRVGDADDCNATDYYVLTRHMLEFTFSQFDYIDPLNLLELLFFTAARNGHYDALEWLRAKVGGSTFAIYGAYSFKKKDHGALLQRLKEEGNHEKHDVLEFENACINGLMQTLHEMAEKKVIPSFVELRGRVGVSKIYEKLVVGCPQSVYGEVIPFLFSNGFYFTYDDLFDISTSCLQWLWENRESLLKVEITAPMNEVLAKRCSRMFATCFTQKDADLAFMSWFDNQVVIKNILLCENTDREGCSEVQLSPLRNFTRIKGRYLVKGIMRGNRSTNRQDALRFIAERGYMRFITLEDMEQDLFFCRRKYVTRFSENLEWLVENCQISCKKSLENIRNIQEDIKKYIL